MPEIRSDRISVGAFYNPHLAQEILGAHGLIDHLAMADPPAADDAAYPEIKKDFPLLLHDYLGQLSDPMSEHSMSRARRLQDEYKSAWVAEHFQCIYTQDHSRSLDYVFPPLYTEEFLQRFVENACKLRDALGAELVMENIPGFFSIEHAQMSEHGFLERFFGESGCGFLIDIPHLWLAAHYAGRNAREYIGKFPLERVVEIHVAGVEEDQDLGGPWIAPKAPPKEILDLALFAAEHAPALRAVTVDAFSPSLTANELLESVNATRRAFGVN